ncbi:hypothetical protein [Weissella confusa]|uniref:hypothetical protein n=1 Tax=Weissella confusa TaxID=1583 RepID=UPI0022E8E439|nr:hypothetical protein [Weissella confusa]
MRNQKVKILGVAAGVLLLGSAGVYAASLINNEPSKAVSEQNSTKKTESSSHSGTSSTNSSASQKSSAAVSSAVNEVSETSSQASSYSTTSEFKPAGEFSEAAAAKSSIMTADSGAPITEDMVKEARKQLENQGIPSGAFSDLNIAQVINKANDESLDYKTAIEELFPGYFN